MAIWQSAKQRLQVKMERWIQSGSICQCTLIAKSYKNFMIFRTTQNFLNFCKFQNLAVLKNLKDLRNKFKWKRDCEQF
jgi:hypothetical protein